MTGGVQPLPDRAAQQQPSDVSSAPVLSDEANNGGKKRRARPLGTLSALILEHAPPFHYNSPAGPGRGRDSPSQPLKSFWNPR